VRINYKHPAAAKVKIYLNGRDVTPLVVEADNDAGWVEMVVLDVNRKPIWDDVAKRPLLVRVHGAVKIELPLQWKCLRCGWKFDSAAAWAKHLITPHIVVEN